jgi:hypothetical protein
MEASKRAGHGRLTPVILATWEAEIRRITVRCQPREVEIEIGFLFLLGFFFLAFTEN